MSCKVQYCCEWDPCASDSSDSSDCESSDSCCQPNCHSDGNEIKLEFKACLNGLSEVPPAGSSATGCFTATLSTGSTRLDFELRTFGLTNIVAAHFHDGLPGVNGPIVKNIAINPTTGNAIGTWSKSDVTQPLTDALLNKLINGQLYVNVHTTQFPGGEIRGQVLVNC